MGFRKSVNLTIKVSELEFFNRDVNFKFCKPISSLPNPTGPLSKNISTKAI